ncbi:ABC transporter substrate-binding protein [Caproiciproducens sp. NJN-50]|uniref:MetQ/NlpA family ABC transporter substrate-binding protein n=1 Tax=Acutalibacteraceae TaxID=3082771 RepID=UPI000FFE02BA|nr:MULTISPECIES: MetQ/NlpA family ABC transporter substrate-binding protein [Acutalibacteraceae]QAT50400.1 ABC transporter substrate-binding protein [Caproiciproducens sp. NJN-50]
MKKSKSVSVLLAALLSLSALAGCANSGGASSAQTASSQTASSQTASSQAASSEAPAVSPAASSASEQKKIVVGASPTPHAEILKEAAKLLKAKGYDLEIKEFSDYVLPNTALEDKQLDANYFQHQPYLTEFNKERGTNIVSAGAIHYEPFGIYAGKTKALANLKDGATVTVPNDTSNEARALLLLQANGLIKLKSGAGVTATQRDIVENKKNLKFREIEAAQLVRSLPDVDIAIINGNYALEGGLKVENALEVETPDSLAATTYANILAVRKGDENREDIKALVEVLKSEEIKTFINDTFKGAVVPVN